MFKRWFANITFCNVSLNFVTNFADNSAKSAYSETKFDLVQKLMLPWLPARGHKSSSKMVVGEDPHIFCGRASEKRPLQSIGKDAKEGNPTKKRHGWQGSSQKEKKSPGGGGADDEKSPGGGAPIMKNWLGAGRSLEEARHPAAQRVPLLGDLCAAGRKKAASGASSECSRAGLVPRSSRGCREVKGRV